MPTAHSSCSFALQSPPPGPAGLDGAIAIVQLRNDIQWGLERLGLGAVEVGRIALREWRAVDSVVVARFSIDAALLFPHGGSANIARVLAALEAAGLERELSEGPVTGYPEAHDPLEARLLHALSRAESPLAIDLLLEQPRRWARAGGDTTRAMDDASSRTLRRVIDPALVVAIGAPNIGKSSLLNALAGRSVAIVADQPGTTRDHVGVSLDLAGLVVRYVDTPGIPLTRETIDPILSEALGLGLRTAAVADLLLLCADTSSAYPASPNPAVPTLRIGLRSDLGVVRQGADVSVSARTGKGLDELASAIRDRLVPPALLADERAWTFW